VNFANMTSAHFIFIPTVLFVGVCIGWVLGSRAARDAYAMELNKRGSGLRAQGSGANRAQGQTGLKTQGSGQNTVQSPGEPPSAGR
jgi:hypothetical protein